MNKKSKEPSVKKENPFSKHLDELSQVVDSWPQWKRDIFGAVYPEDVKQRRQLAERNG